MEMTAKIPNAPAALRISPALASKDSDASDSIEPTTGTIPEKAACAALSANASAEPVSTRLRDRYAVKTAQSPLMRSEIARPPSARIFPSPPPSVAHSAAERRM